MLLPIFEPKNCSEETTRPNWMKLGTDNLYGKTNNIIEAIFGFPPLSRDMGPLRGTPRGPRGSKNFFPIFRFFFIPGLTFRSSLHLIMLFCRINWVVNLLQGAKRVHVFFTLASPRARFSDYMLENSTLSWIVDFFQAVLMLSWFILRILTGH